MAAFTIIKLEPEPMESIIKVEADEIQETVVDIKPPIDEILRVQAGLFLDPVVVLDGQSFTSASGEVHTGSVETLVKIGNARQNLRKPHKCCICLIMFSTRKNLRNHLENIHFRNKVFHCDLCPKLFYTRASIYHHMRVHEEKLYGCNACQYKTANIYYLEKHSLVHDPQFECEICQKKVVSLKHHMKQHETKTVCPICERTIGVDYLNKHVEIHATRTCKVCGEVFTNSRGLKRHVILSKHYNDDIFECHCGSAFVSPENLKRHQKDHTEEMTCGVCDEKFSTLTSLNHHNEMQHGQPKEKKDPTFDCDECELRFTSQELLDQHKSMLHPAVTHQCELCPRQFSGESFLVNHIERDHWSLRPFKCKLCEHRCFSLKHLKVHMMLHKANQKKFIKKKLKQ